MTEAEKPEEESAPKRTKITLKELGLRLPIGIGAVGSVLNKEFAVKRWATKQERELGLLKKPDMSLAAYVSTVVGYMCTKIGPHDMTSKSEAERSVIVSQMYMGDVFYIYCWLRYQSLGQYLSMNLKCKQCRMNIPWKADLETLEVSTVDSIEELFWDFPLEETFSLRGNKVDKFKMTAPRWETLEKISTGSMNTAPAKIGALLGSIIGVNDEETPIVVTELELDDLGLLDLERSVVEFDQYYVGPNMSIEGQCQPSYCKQGGGVDFLFQIDWSFESFFAVSSR